MTTAANPAHTRGPRGQGQAGILRLRTSAAAVPAALAWLCPCGRAVPPHELAWLLPDGRYRCGPCTRGA